jgi:integral membrane protein (TIGR00529 family)
MLDVLKITIIFAAIVVFLRLKWNIGYVLLIASGLLALMYVMPVTTILSTIESTVTDSVTIKLFFALTLIRILEMVLRENEVLAQMMEASRRLLKQKKAVIISMPMFIGMLPSLGGAYFSAPMVDESTKDTKMSAAEKGFINYWFRHPWEYILPLYPGIVLASAITHIELGSLILANMTYAVIIVISGFFLSMRAIHQKIEQKTQKVDDKEKTADWRLYFSFLPIAIILLLVVILHIELHYALGITLLGFFLFYKLNFKYAVRAFKYGFTKDVLLLIFGIMLFKFTMENSSAVEQLSRYFFEKEIPLLPILFILPFISGLLTGLTVGFVGSTFPLLISIAGGAHLNEITFAFASGFVGVLLSPVHLCLVLTSEYFKADMWGIYKKTIPGCAAIMAGALVMYFIL